MSLEIQVATLQPNSQRTFTFSQPVAQYMVGISAYVLSYGEDTDHHVKTMSISLGTNQSGSSLQVTPTLTLDDASGNKIDRSTSSVTIVALAWVGVTDNNLELASANSIANNGSSGALAIPCSNPIVLQAALTGFNLSYGSDDHHLESYLCSVGSQRSGSSASITGLVQMQDHSGHSASTATVNGGLIANCDPSLGLQLLHTDNLQNQSQTLVFSPGVTNVQAFLTSVQAEFQSGKDHHVKSVSANLTVTSQSGLNVTVSGGAYLSDDSGNSQDNSLSSVTGFVIGY